MGYTTKFEGGLSPQRPFEEGFAKYINMFAKTRHMKRDVQQLKEDCPQWEKYSFNGGLGAQGEYFIGGAYVTEMMWMSRRQRNEIARIINGQEEEFCSLFGGDWYRESPCGQMHEKILGIIAEYADSQAKKAKETDYEKNILDYNMPPDSCPGLWCQWVIKDNMLVWDKGEKFYSYVEWLEYLIKNFFGPSGYSLTGSIRWQGERIGDSGVIDVDANHITTRPLA